MKNLFIFVFLLSSFRICAQEIVTNEKGRALEWEDGMTFYTGYFDERNVSEERVVQIYRLLYAPDNYFVHAHVWRIQQMDTVNSIWFNEIMDQWEHEVRLMQLKDLPFWDSIRVLRLKELNTHRIVTCAYLDGFNDPVKLLNVPDPCLISAKALNSNDEALLLAWKELIEDQKKHNGWPENVEHKYQIELASADRLKYARLELMNYAWWNCMNHHVIYHFDNRDPERFTKEFLDLFGKTELIEYDD